ncbi:hypothetical protein J6A34_08330 [bacterium]|nr:hypothetical protein [bacterium]
MWGKCKQILNHRQKFIFTDFKLNSVL